MKIAVEGCAHGKLEKIYDTIEFIQQQNGLKIDLLLCCGDFQATRNVQDLQSMAVPKKYMEMGSFYKYYSGEKTAPVLTLFIGGNHEASNHLQELPYGGWVAPNIYYLGYAGVVNVGGLRIAGISGIFKSHDYMKGRYEKPPYDEKTKRSVYHTRNLDVFRLKQLKEPVDIFISHDWPRGIYKYGNANHLLRMKPFFLCQMTHDELGSPPCEEILFNLKPSYWFSAHLHCKFAALVPHNEEKEIKKTKFLALDKCLPNRKFLQVIDIPIDSEKDLDLEYDVEWLSVLHFTNHLINMKPSNNYLPGPGGSERWNFTPTDIEKEFILKKLSGSLKVPQNFCQTATVHVDKSTPRIKFDDPKPSPQTTTFCEKIGVTDPFALVLECENNPVKKSPPPESPEGESDLSCLYSSNDEFNQSSPWLLDSGNDDTPSPKARDRLNSLLPPPKFSPSPHFDDTDLIIIEDRLGSSYGTDDSVNENVSSEEQDKPLVKKLKRRNLDIYKEEEDTLEDAVS